MKTKIPGWKAFGLCEEVCVHLKLGSTHLYLEDDGRDTAKLHFQEARERLVKALAELDRALADCESGN